MKSLIQRVLSLVNSENNKKEEFKMMAVPKKRRSKSKGRTRLSNWKKKAKEVAKKALSAAKNLGKEKKANISVEKEDSVVPPNEGTGAKSEGNK